MAKNLEMSDLYFFSYILHYLTVLIFYFTLMKVQKEILQQQHCCLRLHMTLIQFGCTMLNLQKGNFSTITENYRLPFAPIMQISATLLHISNTTSGS